MACDYLAIQRSSVSSEKAFSAGGRTGTVDRNQLGTKTFEALQTLRSAYKNKVVSALEEATAAAPKDWCYDFERFRLFAAVILASHLRSSLFETKECLCCQRYCLKFIELVQVFIKD